MSYMTHLKRELSLGNLIALIIILATALILWPLAPKPNPQVSGILLPSVPLTGTAVPADQVKVLQVMPENASVLGTISTKIHYASTTYQSDNAYINASAAFAQKLAGAAGASAIVITQIGRTDKEGPLDGFDLIATAIKN